MWSKSVELLNPYNALTGENKKEPKTNADRIRAMNDEELAVFLEKSTGGCETCAADCTCNGPEDLPAKAVCHQGVLKWLQSPAE